MQTAMDRRNKNAHTILYRVVMYDLQEYSFKRKSCLWQKSYKQHRETSRVFSNVKEHSLRLSTTFKKALMEAVIDVSVEI